MSTQPTDPDSGIEERSHLEDLLLLTCALAAPPDPKSLVETAPRLIEMARQAGDAGAQAHGWRHLGIAHTRLGNLQAARAAYVQAVEMWRQAGDTASELSARQGLANTLELLGEPESALEQALVVANADDWFLRCTGLISTGAIEHLTGDFRNALAHIDEAEQVLVGVETTPRREAYLRAFIDGNRANAHLDRGDLEAALEASQRMATAADMAGQSGQRLEALLNVGLARTRLGDLAEAYRLVCQAHEVASLAGDRYRQASAEWVLAEWYGEAGLCTPAIEHALAARRSANATGAQFADLFASIALCSAYLDDGQIDQATEVATEVRSRTSELRAACLGLTGSLLVGRVALAQGEHTSALAEFQQAASHAQELGALGIAHAAQAHLARALLADGRAAEALGHAEAAAEGAARTGSRLVLWQAQHAAGLACAGLGRAEDALHHLGASIATVERMWWPLWRVGFAQTRRVKRSLLQVYLDHLHTARGIGRDEEVARVLALAPWPFLRDIWEAEAT